MSRLVSFFVLIAIILLIGFLFFRVISPFLLPLFLAALLVVICHPAHELILKRCKNRQRLASALTTALVLLIVLLPLLGITFMAVAEGSALLARQNPSELRERIARTRDRFELLRMPRAEQLRNTQNAISTLVSETDQYAPESTRPMIADVIENVSELRSTHPESSEKVASKFDTVLSKLKEAQVAGENALSGSEYREAIRRAATEFQNVKLELLGGEFQAWIKEMANPTDEDLQQALRGILDHTKGMLFSIGGRTTVIIGRLVVGVVIMAIAMFFFLCDGPGMIDTVMRLSPLDDRYERELLADFSKVSRAVVLATLLSAAAQGILAGIGYYLIGLQGTVLLTLLTALLAMVPFVGAAAVWVPVALWLYFIDERLGAAVLLAIHGALLVSNVDNLIKPLVLHGKSQLHPLLALLSVLGGVNALGPIGILVGPMTVAFLQTLLNILHRELSQFDDGSAESPSVVNSQG
ncbi:MAG: AI-2E family transporter [Planctomycetota bacterium]